MSNHKAWTNPKLSPVENALLIAAYLVGREKVKEEGVNRGAWVTKFLGYCGLGPGFPWCAAFVTFCLKEAGYKGGYPICLAAVRNWAAWAKKKGKLTKNPRRGDLGFWLNSDGTGHIFFIVDADRGYVETLEGNTDADGSREGDGAYRKKRLISSKMQFIRL
jgi:hypothetical protein